MQTVNLIANRLHSNLSHIYTKLSEEIEWELDFQLSRYAIFGHFRLLCIEKLSFWGFGGQNANCQSDSKET